MKDEAEVLQKINKIINDGTNRLQVRKYLTLTIYLLINFFFSLSKYLCTYYSPMFYLDGNRLRFNINKATRKRHSDSKQFR